MHKGARGGEREGRSWEGFARKKEEEEKRGETNVLKRKARERESREKMN